MKHTFTAPAGQRWIAADWRAGRLAGARLWSPAGWVRLRPAATDDPRWGTSDVVEVGGVSSHCAAVRWHDPLRIPALAAPGVLPTGVGASVLNFLSLAAKGPLKYEGPYPTPGLFAALMSCFRVADEPAARTAFSLQLSEGLWSGKAVVPDVLFWPDPFTWRVSEGAHLMWRRGPLRAHALSRTFAPGGGFRRLTRVDGGSLAALWVGGECLHEVVRFDADGRALATPSRPPKIANALVGGAVPVEVWHPLRDALVAAVPDGLSAAAAEVLASRTLFWGDAGLDVVVEEGERFLVHAELPAYLSPRELLVAMYEALLPVVVRHAQQRALAALGYARTTCAQSSSAAGSMGTLLE